MSAPDIERRDAIEQMLLDDLAELTDRSLVAMEEWMPHVFHNESSMVVEAWWSDVRYIIRKALAREAEKLLNEVSDGDC